MDKRVGLRVAEKAVWAWIFIPGLTPRKCERGKSLRMAKGGTLGHHSLSANAAYKGAPSPTSGKAPPPTPSSPAIPTALPGSGVRRQCQLCGYDGHWTSKCHRRFQKSFLGLGNDGKDTRNTARQVAMADRPAPQPKQSQPQGQTQSYSVDPYWYMDSGATEHLTSEMGKLQTKEPYRGSDKVHTANGAGPGNAGGSA
ncbi:hypothetical protein QYE76_018011 [Lolium multiflorum]|uniref:CCHC-type domain-containing protein n=1 Tax=Lolium multiflorum TaxID=4521 RepID=A0AAD8QIZ9_LOLMU|nr:hypothetical protein QYE76_018011 [Lolium multiflorum]